MKLTRVGHAGHDKPVVPVAESIYVDVSDVTADSDEAFFGAADSGGRMLGEQRQEVIAPR